MVGTAARSRLGAWSRVGTWSGLGAAAATAAAKAPLGLLVASRSPPMRVAMALETPVATDGKPFAPMVEEFVRSKTHWLLAAVLATLLVATTWYCVAVWKATPFRPLSGNIIVAVSAVTALFAGCGLIALMFYSQRSTGQRAPSVCQITKSTTITRIA